MPAYILSVQSFHPLLGRHQQALTTVPLKSARNLHRHKESDLQESHRYF